MVARLLKEGHLGRIRFDIAIRNAIRGQQHSEGPLMPMPSEFAIDDTQSCAHRNLSHRKPFSRRLAVSHLDVL